MVMPVECPLDPVQEQETSREGSQVPLPTIELSTNLHEVFTVSREASTVYTTIKLMGGLVNKVEAFSGTVENFTNLR